MAKNRSRRLRKKMHIDEFQELGFSVAWRFPEGTSEEQIDKTVDDFINEVIEPNKLAFDGSGYLAWEDARSSRRDKVFTPHPAWKTRTLLSIWGQQMLA